MARMTRGFIDLSPWHQRGVDYIIDTFTTDGSDCEIHIFQTERVSGDLFERKTTRGELLQCQFARFVAMSSGALDADELQGQFGDREIGKLHHFSLNHYGARLSFKCVDAEQ